LSVIANKKTGFPGEARFFIGALDGAAVGSGRRASLA
jgi:hypothetical protein